jgi:hypothetical protein
MEGSCEHSNELLGSLKCWKFLSSCTTGGFSRSAQLHEISLLCQFTYGLHLIWTYKTGNVSLNIRKRERYVLACNNESRLIYALAKGSHLFKDLRLKLLLLCMTAYTEVMQERREREREI